MQGWEKVCSTKKMNRFQPPEVKEGLQQLEIAKEHLQVSTYTICCDPPVDDSSHVANTDQLVIDRLS